MYPKFRKLVIIAATVIAVVATTLALPGSAQARWGWRGVDGVGVGAVSASDSGLVYFSLPLHGPITADTTATVILLIAMATAILLMATDIVAPTMAAIIRAIGTPVTPIVGLTMDMPAIRIVDLIKKTAFGRSFLFECTQSPFHCETLCDL
jgi:hypothetical protein